MNVRRIDPRDTGWEIDAPTYRVYLWKAQAPASQPPRGYKAEEYELAGANDVREVIDWAEEMTTNGSTYVLYALVEHGTSSGLVRLVGKTPGNGALEPNAEH